MYVCMHVRNVFSTCMNWYINKMIKSFLNLKTSTSVMSIFALEILLFSRTLIYFGYMNRMILNSQINNSSATYQYIVYASA